MDMDAATRQKEQPLRRAYFTWAACLGAAVLILLLDSMEPPVWGAILTAVGSYLTWVVVGTILLSFVCEYISATLGMGYGTSLTPALLLLGLEPRDIVPAVLLSQLLTGITAALLHHRIGNVSLHRGSRSRKVVYVLAGSSVGGTLLAVAVSLRVPASFLKVYIGALVLAVGVVILITIGKTFRFSWGRIAGLGLVAAFNKGLSGGGYGPLVTGGQLVAGLDPKGAVAITSAAEGLTCIVGVLLYAETTGINSRLALPVVVGAMCSVPLSVISVKAVAARDLRVGMGALTVLLGLLTLAKALL
jgi:uncharacterized membrane protein YfcA